MSLPPETRSLPRLFKLLASHVRIRPRHPFAPSLRRAVLWSMCVCLLTGPSAARGGSKEQMQSLDEQVQEIKSDALSIAAELTRLEEKLLYPSNTQVAVFVSLDESQAFRLDSLQVRIDGELVAHHLYSFKELEALKKGGVQRIYTGNVSTGEHRIEVSIAGKRPSGGDVLGTESFAFRKNVEPKLVEIKLAGREAGDALIRIGGS